MRGATGSIDATPSKRKEAPDDNRTPTRRPPYASRTRRRIHAVAKDVHDGPPAACRRASLRRVPGFGGQSAVATLPAARSVTVQRLPSASMGKARQPAPFQAPGQSLEACALAQSLAEKAVRTVQFTNAPAPRVGGQAPVPTNRCGVV